MDTHLSDILQWPGWKYSVDCAVCPHGAHGREARRCRVQSGGIGEANGLVLLDEIPINKQNHVLPERPYLTRNKSPGDAVRREDSAGASGEKE